MGRVHDMGGVREHFGPIPVADRGMFHAPWEPRVIATTMLVVRVLDGNIDAFRYALEELPPAVYLAGYCQRWLAGIEGRLVKLGVLAPGELDAAVQGKQPPERGARRVGRARVWLWNRLVPRATGPMPRWFLAIFRRVQRQTRPERAPARFAVGDRVVVSAEQPRGHTRRPRYAWGRTGTIARAHGAMVFADRHAAGEEVPEHVYTVAFDGRELWGDDAEPGTGVCVDLFESYLEKAP
jgi:nitrile hydratase